MKSSHTLWHTRSIAEFGVFKALITIRVSAVWVVGYECMHMSALANQEAQSGLHTRSIARSILQMTYSYGIRASTGLGALQWTSLDPL